MLVQPAPPKVAAEIAEFVRWLGLQSGKVAKTVSPSTVRNYASYTRRLLVIVRDEALTYEKVKEIAVRETSARGNKTSTWNVWTDSVRAYDRFRQTRCKDETHRALAVRGAKGWNPVECKRGKHGFSLLMVREARTDTEHHKKVTREMHDTLIEAARRANDTVFERFLLTAWDTMARGGEQRSDIGEISAAELLMLKVKDFNFAGTFEYPDAEGEVVLRYGGKKGKGEEGGVWYPG